MKNTVASLGGESMCSCSVKSSPEKLDASTSDEFINYPDPVITERSENHSKGHLGVASAASYDCHPSDNTRIRTREALP